MAEANKLLFEIQQAVGCPYLSDLHSDCRLRSKQSKVIVMATPLERYTLQEWNVAASYITGKTCCCQTIEEARARIMAGR